MTFTTKTDVVARCSGCDSPLAVHQVTTKGSDDVLHLKIDPCIVCYSKFSDDVADEIEYDDLDDLLPEYVQFRPNIGE